jgi:hypothetical protein
VNAQVGRIRVMTSIVVSRTLGAEISSHAIRSRPRPDMVKRPSASVRTSFGRPGINAAQPDPSASRSSGRWRGSTRWGRPSLHVRGIGQVAIGRDLHSLQPHARVGERFAIRIEQPAADRNIVRRQVHVYRRAFDRIGVLAQAEAAHPAPGVHPVGGESVGRDHEQALAPRGQAVELCVGHVRRVELEMAVGIGARADRAGVFGPGFGRHYIDTRAGEGFAVRSADAAGEIAGGIGRTGRRSAGGTHGVGDRCAGSHESDRGGKQGERDAGDDRGSGRASPSARPPVLPRIDQARDPPFQLSGASNIPTAGDVARRAERDPLTSISATCSSVRPYPIASQAPARTTLSHSSSRARHSARLSA